MAAPRCRPHKTLAEAAEQAGHRQIHLAIGPPTGWINRLPRPSIREPRIPAPEVAMHQRRARGAVVIQPLLQASQQPIHRVPGSVTATQGQLGHAAAAQRSNHPSILPSTGLGSCTDEAIPIPAEAPGDDFRWRPGAARPGRGPGPADRCRWSSQGSSSTAPLGRAAQGQRLAAPPAIGSAKSCRASSASASTSEQGHGLRVAALGEQPFDHPPTSGSRPDGCSHHPPAHGLQLAARQRPVGSHQILRSC